MSVELVTVTVTEVKVVQVLVLAAVGSRGKKAAEVGGGEKVGLFRFCKKKWGIEVDDILLKMSFVLSLERNGFCFLRFFDPQMLQKTAGGFP